MKNQLQNQSVKTEPAFTVLDFWAQIDAIKDFAQGKIAEHKPADSIDTWIQFSGNIILHIERDSWDFVDCYAYETKDSGDVDVSRAVKIMFE